MSINITSSAPSEHGIASIDVESNVKREMEASKFQIMSRQIGNLTDAAEVEPKMLTPVDQTETGQSSPSYSPQNTNSRKRLISDKTKIEERHNWRTWFMYFLEPAVFCGCFASNLSSSMFTNQILFETCRTTYKYDEQLCQPFLGAEKPTNESKNIEDEIQRYSNNVLLARNLIESISPALISLFIGPWSDKFGRRPLLLAASIGFTLYSFILLILSIVAKNSPLSPWLYLIGSAPIMLTGGNCVLLTAIYSYISDLYVEKERVKKMIIMDGVTNTGIGMGSFMGGYIYAATNASTIFALSGVLMVVTVIYYLVLTAESLKAEDIQKDHMISGLFRIELIKDLFKACIRQRAENYRSYIWLAIFTLVISNFAYVGDTSVQYLFLRKKFNWTAYEYSTFEGVCIVIGVIGCGAGIILLIRIYKLTSVTMSLICLLSACGQSIITALSPYWWELYLAVVVGLMSGILTPMVRVILSFFTLQSEFGKVFALATSLQYLIALGAAPLYTAVYNATLANYPGVTNMVSAGQYLFCFALISVVYYRRK